MWIFFIRVEQCCPTLEGLKPLAVCYLNRNSGGIIRRLQRWRFASVDHGRANPKMNRRVLAACLVILACLPWSRLSASEASARVHLPDPDLTGLEAAVAEQLRSYREITLEQIADPDAGAEETAAAVGELGRYYHAYELAAPAEECYRTAIGLTPLDFRWHYFLGYLHQKAGRLEEAEAAYLRALEIYRAAPPALLRLAEVYIELDRLEAAASLMREALALDPTSAAAEAALGELYQRMGRNEEAIALLRSAIEKVPAANRLFYPLALAYRATGKMDEARRLMSLQGKVGVKPADPLIDGLEGLKTGERVHSLNGQAAFRAGRYAEAVEAFRRAVEADPSSVTARINLGSALGEMGDVDEAIEQYEKALEIAAGNATALFNLGMLLADRGELAEALQHLRLAAQFEPEDAVIRLELAETHRRNGDLEDALIHYRAAAELEPPGEDARLGAARVLVALRRFSEARDVLEEGLRQLPTSGFLAHPLSRLLAMGPDLEVRDGVRALELATRVYAARPMAAHAEVVAAAHAEQGQCDEAALWQQRAIDASSEASELRRQVLSLYQAGAPCRYPGQESEETSAP